MHRETPEYEVPDVVDYGDLVELTTHEVPPHGSVGTPFHPPSHSEHLTFSS